jgi:glycosyltransferase involved in cell wall biosynthesis
LKGFDVVHFHGIWSPAHLRMQKYCQRLCIPAVVSPHGMLEPWAWRHRRWKKWPYFHLLEKRRLGGAQALLATAAEEAANLKRFFPLSRVEMLPLGIEPDISPDHVAARRHLGWEDGERVLLYLSRVHPKKGLLELLQALQWLAAQCTMYRLRLVIVGDGPADYVAVCRQQVAGLHPQLRVDWLPPVWGAAKWPYLQGADLFCLPTYSENFGLVVLEAGIVGTPVFTTTGTPWQVIADEGLGWVVDPRPELYRGVLKAFLDRADGDLQSMRQRIASWTRAHFVWPSLIRRYVDFYTAIAPAGPKA